MTTVDRFAKRLQQVLPRVEVEVDRPRDGGGTWWVDASLGDHRVTIDWRPRRGFGVSSASSDSYGERSDEVYSDLERTVRRVAALLRTGAKTESRRDMILRQLREERELSQADVAQFLGVSQAAISKLEGRRDPRIGTLRKVVAALGGRLELVVRFPDQEVRIVQPAPKTRSPRR